MLRTMELNDEPKAPGMEWYFDEVTKRVEVRCPATLEVVTVVMMKRASPASSGFEDVIECPYFKGLPTCRKLCLFGVAEH
ncbi:MAG: hypothetical protein QXX77_05575 [Candidatus Methanosuratincola sp.]|jgi:hypothetical protein